jgi:hypothetical protein
MSKGVSLACIPRCQHLPRRKFRRDGTVKPTAHSGTKVRVRERDVGRDWHTQ